MNDQATKKKTSRIPEGAEVFEKKVMLQLPIELYAIIEEKAKEQERPLPGQIRYMLKQQLGIVE